MTASRAGATRMTADHAAAALADAEPAVLWLDDPARPPPRPPLATDTTADLVIVGGGFSGLWTALLAAQRHPRWEIVLGEGQRIGWAGRGGHGGGWSGGPAAGGG